MTHEELLELQKTIWESVCTVRPWWGYVSELAGTGRLVAQGERLTERRRLRFPLRCQARICEQAVSTIHGPIARIRPVKSAFERKWRGNTSPSSGCCQRRKASKPSTRREVMP